MNNLTTTTTTKRTVTSRENMDYNEALKHGANQSYAPYFLNSLRDQTVREGESVLFEIVISGKDLIFHFFIFYSVQFF
jgi:formylmethanofuran:tetrahydromethanopterin formyltransferase